MNEGTNICTDEQKDENYIPLGINAGGIKNVPCGYQFSVGLKSGGSGDSRCKRVVSLRLKTQWLLISAFPI